MKQKFTHNHLIKFIYNETNVEETLAIKDALNSDSAFSDDYNQLMQGFNQLPKASFAPSDVSIQNILAYSEKTTVETHF